MSIERLIDLARRTGDRLIVHDPAEDVDIVIMDLDSYEALIDSSQTDVFGVMSDEPAFDFDDITADRPSEDIIFESSNVESEHRPDPVNPFETTFTPDEDAHISQEEDPVFEAPQSPSPDPSFLETVSSNPIPHWSVAGEVIKEKFDSMKSQEQSNDVTVEDLPFDVPFKKQENIGELDEQRLDDDPVFLEEPI